MSDFQERFLPFRKDLKKQKKMGGANITFVHWSPYVARLEQVWGKDFDVLKDVYQFGEGSATGHVLIVKTSITDPHGRTREAFGAADINKEKSNYGGAFAEAEAESFKRCCAYWGIGLEMYMDPHEKRLLFKGDIVVRPKEPKKEPPHPQAAKLHEPEPVPNDEADAEYEAEHEADYIEGQKARAKAVADRMRKHCPSKALAEAMLGNFRKRWREGPTVEERDETIRWFESEVADVMANKRRSARSKDIANPHLARAARRS